MKFKPGYKKTYNRIERTGTPEKKPDKKPVKKGKDGLLDAIADFLAGLLHAGSMGRGNRRLKRELVGLASGRRGSVEEFYRRKIKVLVLALAGGSFLSGSVFLLYHVTDWQEQKTRLERPDYGEEDRSEELEAELENGENRILAVSVQNRKYTKEERRKLLADAGKQLDGILRNQNKSLDEVRSDLRFPASLMDGAVQADWTTLPYGVIDDDGKLLEPSDEKGILVEIQCMLTCQGEERDMTFYAKVFPPVLTEKEKLWSDLAKKIKEADEKENTDRHVTLPAEIDGQSVIWKEPGENPAGTILFLTILAVLCLAAGMDGKVHRQAEQRAAQLALDYPDFLWKLSMLIGAGLTIKSAFVRMGEQYRRNRKTAGGKPRFAYEELLTACHEMQSGIPEAEAYERFGRRCQLTGYIRLGTYLAQNLRKGSRGLQEFLLREAAASLEERKNNARKMGEKAGTKLLLPMVLMLGIVIAVLMVPAFMNI